MEANSEGKCMYAFMIACMNDVCKTVLSAISNMYTYLSLYLYICVCECVSDR